MVRKIIFVAAAFFVLAACQKPPSDEMNRAIDALNRAENDSDAVTYALNTLNQAREALRKMQEEAAVKRFDSAKVFAGDVVTYAERAVSEGRAMAGQLKDRAQNLVDSLQPILAEAEAAFNAAKTGNLQVNYDELGKILDTAKQNLENAKRSLTENNFQDAIDKTQGIRSALGDITSRIGEAAQDLFRKK